MAVRHLDHESADMYITMPRQLSRPTNDTVASFQLTIISSYKGITVASFELSIDVFLGLFQSNVHIAINRLQFPCVNGSPQVRFYIQKT